MSRSVIDKLPEAQRQRVVNALLAGASLRKAASLAGVSHTQVGEYKKKVLAPALQVAEKVNALRVVADSQDLTTVSPETLPRAVISAAPLVSRIAEHQKAADTLLASAVGKQDARGAAAVISADLKGLELQARLTGLLDSGTHVHVNQLAVIMSPKDEPEVIEIQAEPSE